jgi:uncharacterized protein involved in type VI secretion and phage assembly
VERYESSWREDRYYGKYRGTVEENVDPDNRGRLKVQVPDIAINPSTWALPCFPFASLQQGFFIVPSMKSSVWVEFEQGDTDYPVWSGCFFDEGVPVPAPASETPPDTQALVIQTQGQNLFVLSDAPGPTGGILLKAASGAMISINDSGITITNGQGATITLSGPSINLNNGALEVI